MTDFVHLKASHPGPALLSGPTAPATVAEEHTGQPAEDHSWRIVYRFLIRSAGFPFEIMDFGSEQVGAALTQRAELRAAAAALRAQWPEHFGAAVRRLERKGADRATFKVLYRARREVSRYRPLPPEAAAHLDAEWVRDWHHCLARLDTAERGLDQAVRAATEYSRGRLRSLLAERRFMAALIGSNPELADRLRRSLSSDPAGRRSATRQDERVVYAYAQRFATKNETASFFGPIDYGTFDRQTVDGVDTATRDTVQVRYAPEAIQRRWVRLSHWAVQALADRIAEDPEIAQHLPLRLREGCTVLDERTLLIAPTGRRVPLRPGHAAALTLVMTGPITMAELMRRLAEPAIAQDLRARRMVTCRPLVPTALDDPATWLLGMLAGLRHAGVTAAAPWHDLLRALIDRAFAMSWCADAQRPTRLTELETVFSAATGHPARRGSGEHYADRLLVTEDCRGGVIACVVPARQAQVLARRLAPTLLLCASYSVLVQAAVLARAHLLYHRLARQGPVSYLRLVAELDRTTSMAEVSTDPALTGWMDRFDQLVRSATSQHTARIDPGALGRLLREPPAGLVVSPDIFVCSDPSGMSLEHAEVVVGEIHHGAQVWSHLSVFDPDLARTGRDVAAVTGTGDELAALVCRRTQGKAFERELPGPAVPFRATATAGHSRVLAPESLLVREKAGALQLAAPDGTVVTLRPRHPRSPSNWLFGPPPVVAPVPLRGAARVPRVLIGDVVAWRRTWRMDGEQVGELTTPRHPAGLVRAVADLREHLDLPRLVFIRTPLARKPVFADLQCPTSLRHLAHYLRNSPSAELTEMLPEPRHWWLRPAGHRVSCEWRLTLGWTGSAGGELEPLNPGAQPHA
jgi:hypothetical protein